MPHLQDSMPHVLVMGWIPAKEFIGVAAISALVLGKATSLVRGFMGGEHVLGMVSPAGSVSYGMGVDFL